MPRKPKGHRRSLKLKPQPLIFSRFARSVAQLASVPTVRGQAQKVRVHRESLPNPTSNGFLKKSLIEKSDQSESSEDEGFEGVVQADFVFFDPKPDDFHGVKILLQTYLDTMQWDLSGFVDLILAQSTVGTVVKIEGDDDDSPFSVVTALNLGRYKDVLHDLKLLDIYNSFSELITVSIGNCLYWQRNHSFLSYQDHECMMELKEYLLKVCQGKDVINNLRLLLGEQAHDVGLLVSQRVVNLPPQLLPPMYDALFDEVSWATEDEPTKELRNSFCFKFYLLVCKIYKLKNASQKKKPSSQSDEEIIYIKPEDEIFHQLSCWSFSFPLHTQQVETQELKNYRLTGLVMAVEAEKISTFREQLQSLIAEP